GPIIRPAGPSLHRALTQLDSGESWLIQPRQIDSSGHMWSPGVKLGVKPGSWSHRNEWFGPVLAIMHAPDFETAIDWQNATDFGLTAGVHALDEKECELWISRIEAGNLYVNRGTTGAVVNRQPFGGWKRSSVGPTSKAGGANYLNNLRNWDSLTDLSELIESSSHWWDAIGSKAIDASGLLVERNYQLYKISHRTYVVRIDESTSLDAINYIHWVGEKTGSTIEFSTERENIRVAHAIVESVSDLAARLVSPEKVRWLSNELLPASVLLNKGISADTRPIAARGDVELPRWVLEQSVSITNHRYGNVGAGPRPRITME
ncbi:MAG: aldehyde dehydrogenase family protein, partial [Actinobacteria bacterium]|nr:aldehyde dehydrogenase family protein [Actinomycetota bacterium]